MAEDNIEKRRSPESRDFERALDIFRSVQPGQSVRFECKLGDYRLGMTVIGDRGEIAIHNPAVRTEIITIDDLRDYLYKPPASAGEYVCRQRIY